MDSFKVEGKRIIVTGGARGIGAANVRNLVKNGAKIVIFDMLDEPANKLVQELAAGPGKVSFFHVDILNREEVFDTTKKAVAYLGALDSVTTSPAWRDAARPRLYLNPP
ncbi:hypothetical protein BDW75DRAFT_225629 [Aspergillus navahoensis]